MIKKRYGILPNAYIPKEGDKIEPYDWKGKRLMMITHSDGTRQYFESLPEGGFTEITKENENDHCIL